MMMWMLEIGNREWGEPIVMDENIKQQVDEIWEELNILSEDIN